VLVAPPAYCFGCAIAAQSRKGGRAIAAQSPRNLAKAAARSPRDRRAIAAKATAQSPRNRREGERATVLTIGTGFGHRCAETPVLSREDAEDQLEQGL